MSEAEKHTSVRKPISKNKPRMVLSPGMKMIGNGLRITAKLSPSLAANIAAHLWFMPMMGKPEAHIADWQDKAQQKNPLTFGNDLHIFTNGVNLDAPLVLCVHGWRGRGFQFRRFIQPLVDAGFRVAVFDAPAHAGAANEKRWTTFFEFVDAVKEIEKAAGPIDSIITHSFGSPTTAFTVDADFKPRKIAMIAGNFDVEYYLSSFTTHLGFDEKFKQRIRAKVIKLADKRVFKGAYQKIHIDFIPEEMASVDSKFWYDPEDKEINTQSIHVLSEKLGGKPIQLVEGVGHFEILKSAEVIESVLEFIQE